MGNPNSIPYEVIAAPFSMYTAPVGEAYPLIDAVPGGNWLLLGTSGNLSYMEDGISVEHSEDFTEWMSLGDVGTRKVFRTKESLKIGLTLADITLEQYKHALNGNAITTAAASSGVAGYKKIGLSRGSSVSQFALLLRGPSPYGDNFTLQYEVPIAFQTGQPEVVFTKDKPAGLKLQWTAIIDPNAANATERFGRIVAQYQAALP